MAKKKFPGVKTVTVKKRRGGWGWRGWDGNTWVRRGAYSRKSDAIRGAKRACGPRVQVVVQ